MGKTEHIEKARQVKLKNDNERKKDASKKIKKIDNFLEANDCSITEACRKYSLSVDKYYRMKRKV